MLQSEAQKIRKRSLSAQRAANAVFRKRATGMEKQQMPPPGRSPTRAAVHSLCISVVCPSRQLSLGTMLSAAVKGSCVTTARRHLFQEEIIIVINFIGRELCPSQIAGSRDCLGSVNSSGFVNANGSKASLHWKGNCFCSRKAQACTSTEEEIIFSKLSGKDLIKGTAQTVYSAAASNRHLELGERLPW